MVFVYFVFFSIIFAIILLNWLLGIIWKKKYNTLLDKILKAFVLTYLLSFWLSLITYMGIGQRFNPADFSSYIANHPVNVLYLSLVILATGFIQYLKLFIFDETESFRKKGILIVILPFCLMSLFNAVRLITYKGITLYEFLKIWDWRYIFIYGFLITLFELASFIFYIYLIIKTKNRKTFKLVRFLLIFTSITLSINVIMIISAGIEFSSTILGINHYQIISTAIIIINFVYATGFVIYLAKYQLLSLKIIIKNLAYNILLAITIMLVYTFILYPILYKNQTIIPSMITGFLIFICIILTGRLYHKLDWLIGYIFYPKKYKILKELEELNKLILNILDLHELKTFLEKKILSTFHTQIFACYILRENKNYFSLLIHKDFSAPPKEDLDTPLIKKIMQAKDILIFDQKLLWKEIYLLIPIKFRNRLLGFFVFGRQTMYGSFDADDLRIFKTLALNTGICLENIYLNNKIVKIETETIKQENIILKSELEQKNLDINMVGKSLVLQNVITMSGRVAQTDAAVLITGQNGVGKELVAKKIHDESIRVTGPFITINCATIPENLLESELFGFKRGAFTGAIKDKKGLLASASGGTVFFDEIGDLPLSLQPKLLRALQEKRITPLGSNKEEKLDIRLISATNKDLKLMIKQKTFRQDLYYRINVINIKVPPLRQRKEDIPLLIEYFLKRHSIAHNKIIKSIDSQAITALSKYNWPGNVRELSNALEHGIILSSDGIIKISDLPSQITKKVSTSSEIFLDGSYSLAEQIKRLEKELILKALKRCKNNRTKAAKLLGVDRNRLNYLLRKYGI